MKQEPPCYKMIEQLPPVMRQRLDENKWRDDNPAPSLDNLCARAHRNLSKAYDLLRVLQSSTLDAGQRGELQKQAVGSIADACNCAGLMLYADE